MELFTKCFCTLHYAPTTMTVQIKIAKAEGWSTEVCNWILGGICELCFSSAFSLPCASVAVVFYCSLILGRQVCGIAEIVRAPKESAAHLKTCLDSCTCLFAGFISCKKMSCNLFLLAFVLGMTGTFHYGLQVSIINSPAEVSMESSKSELPIFHCSQAFMPLFAMANFLLVLSKLIIVVYSF